MHAQPSKEFHRHPFIIFLRYFAHKHTDEEVKLYKILRNGQLSLLRTFGGVKCYLAICSKIEIVSLTNHALSMHIFTYKSVNFPKLKSDL